MAQAALGERAEAMSSLEKSIAAAPRFDRPYTNLARVLLEDGKKAEAERVLRKLLEVAPEHPVAREMLEQVK
jgi:Flp pilus assembly protein TadD